jgi:hypothetical protein
MQIYGEITGIKYKPFLCNTLVKYDIEEFDKALSESGSFILEIDKENRIAVSRWCHLKGQDLIPMQEYMIL